MRLLFAKRTATIQTMHCEIEEVAHVEDATAYPCGRDAVAKCSDCGAALCDSHIEDCAVCNQTFCNTCLAFHSRANHQKKGAVWAEIAQKIKKKSA